MLNDTLGAGILYSVTKGKRQFNVSQRKIMVLDDIFFDWCKISKKLCKFAPKNKTHYKNYMNGFTKKEPTRIRSLYCQSRV